MSETAQQGLEKSARQWLRARNCIAKALAEIWALPELPDHEHNAAAIIARLAHLDPPLLLCEPDEMKE